MRVLFVNENIGGHATYHRHLAGSLEGSPRIDAEFLDAAPPGLMRRIAGVQVPGLSGLDADLQRLRATLAASLVLRSRVRRRLRTGRFDAIHVFSQNAALLWPDLLQAAPSVVALDSTNELNAYVGFRRAGPLTPATLRLEQTFERRVYNAATLVAPLSEWAADSLRRGGVPTEKTRVVPFGVPEQETNPSMPGHHPVPGLPEIVFVGRHLERKGGLLLLDLHQRHLAHRCVLTMVTPDPVEPRPGVRVVSDIVPGDGRIARILARGAAFVFPTLMDQSPNAVLEAMAAGLPIVAFGVGAIPEMVGTAGRVVPPGDVAGLVNAIVAILDEPEIGRQMGRLGQRRVGERYGADGAAEARIELLQEACRRFDRRRGSRRPTPPWP